MRFAYFDVCNKDVNLLSAQGGCGCLIPGGDQGWVGWDPEQPGHVFSVEVDGSVCCREVGDS